MLKKFNIDRAFNIGFVVSAVVVTVIVALRSAWVPFSHDEAGTFFMYIQTGNFEAYKAHTDANNHVLNSFLSWICFQFFGDSPFALRIPNLIGFFMLILGVKRISGYLSNVSSKALLVAGFLLSFHWLSFFSACRGYGLSMALLVLGLSFLLSYIYTKHLKYLLYCYLALDLAISANLILIIITLTITGLVTIHQLYDKQFFKKKNLLLLLAHAIVIAYWTKFSFFLQKSGALYYGQGESYWKTTFVTLIHLLVGKESSIAEMTVVMCFIMMITAITYKCCKNSRNINKNLALTAAALFSMALSALLLGFYLMKKVQGINYPEDRTGLFFYVFYVLSAVFISDLFRPRHTNIIAAGVLLFSLVHFAYYMNFRKHSLYTYGTMPPRFYNRLLEEQSHSERRITIGGHRLCELFYGFMNYRHDGALNPMDDPECMHMNMDYYLATIKEKPYYNAYYDELDVDKDWDFTLLRRKEKIERKLIMQYPVKEAAIDGKTEFYGFFEKLDTVFASTNPIMVEFDITVIKAETPPLSWLVLGIDSAQGKTSDYKRIRLHWLRNNWDYLENDRYKVSLVSGRLPDKVQRMVCYLWNNGKQQLQFKLNGLRVYQLEGNGVNVVAPDMRKAQKAE